MKSIRSKLWLGMMTLVGVTLILLWLLQIVFLESFYTGMRITAIKGQLDSVADLIRDGNSSQTVLLELDRIASARNLSLQWVDASGEALYQTDTGSPMPMMQNRVFAELLGQTLSGQSVEANYTHPRFGNEYRLLGIPVLGPNQSLLGALLAMIPLAPVAETASILRQQLLYITISLLIVTAVLSWWLARGFTRGILGIRQVTAAMAAGDYSARADFDSGDEIGMLARSINYLGEQLAKVEQLRHDLVANVSHELRTPLAVIRGYAETIRDITGDQPVRRAEQLEIIIEETERLTDLVNDNLQLALLQSGNAPLVFNAVPIAEVLRGAVDSYALLAEQRSVQLRLQNESDLIVRADGASIEQVARNLIQNSLQHTPAGGRIDVSLAAQADAVRVSVSDTGTGISAADLPYIWDKYYRGEAEGADRRSGSGLGLAIVKGILEAHHARYGVDSKVNAGTTIWFDLQRLAD